MQGDDSVDENWQESILNREQKGSKHGLERTRITRKESVFFPIRVYCPASFKLLI